jgi:FkbM family methyltransferase
MTGSRTLRKTLGRIKRYVLWRWKAPALNRILCREVEEWRQRVAALEQELVDQRQHEEKAVCEVRNRVGAMMNESVVQTILHSSADSHFECVFNGVPAILPRDTLRIMRYCIHVQVDAPFVVEVESAHEKWLLNKLKPGDVFLDVGAATGAMTLPIAKTVPDVRIIAFEPNRTTNRALHETLRRNNVSCVEVIDKAVSDANGTATFAELKFDTNGDMPWKPEGSAIANSVIVPDYISETYEVATTTLDAFFASRSDESAVRSVKIDIEGFEVLALKGAKSFLARVRPFIAIDIHRDPFGEGTTEAGVRALLEPNGYRFEKIGHVLLCYPHGA